MSTQYRPRRLKIAILPDAQADAVVSERAAAQMLSISTDTLRRTVERGAGPCRISLSPRRVGYRLIDLRAWLENRARRSKNSR